jgi:DNA-binding HxlR family transcriptional regulator
MGNVPDDPCAISRSLGVLGERWTLLVLREVAMGTNRFSEIRKHLGVASDILAERLTTLVTHGVLEKIQYQDPGARARHSYALTPAGHELSVVLAALQQWGDEHLPWPAGPSVVRRVRGTEESVHVGFLDAAGREVELDRFEMVKTSVYPSGG